MPPSWTEQALAQSLQPLVTSYFPLRGAIHLVVGILLDDQRYVFTFSREKDTAGQAVDESTLFEIGSSTMAFTAGLLAQMVLSRGTQLTDPVQKYLPIRIPSSGGQEITLLDLAQHTSGLPRLPANFPETISDPGDPCRNYTVEHLYGFLANCRLGSRIGWRREYSNLGMGLLGHALALTSHQDYEAALGECVCGPLSLADTTVALTGAQRERLVRGHSATGEPAPPWDMASLVGAGGLRSTARDLLTFLQNHWAKESPLAAALNLCRSPRPKSGRPLPGLARYAIALALASAVLTVLWHSALMPGMGWFLVLFLLPVVGAALCGGIGPGTLTAGVQCTGAALLYGQEFNVPAHALAALLLSWLGSAIHRERARKECLGWHQARLGNLRHGRRVFWHSGETGGYASFMALEDGRECGVVILANCAKPVANLGFEVLATLNERSHTPSQESKIRAA